MVKGFTSQFTRAEVDGDHHRIDHGPDQRGHRQVDRGELERGERGKEPGREVAEHQPGEDAEPHPDRQPAFEDPHARAPVQPLRYRLARLVVNRAHGGGGATDPMRRSPSPG